MAIGAHVLHASFDGSGPSLPTRFELDIPWLRSTKLTVTASRCAARTTALAARAVLHYDQQLVNDTVLDIVSLLFDPAQVIETMALRLCRATDDARHVERTKTTCLHDDVAPTNPLPTVAARGPATPARALSWAASVETPAAMLADRVARV